MLCASTRACAGTCLAAVTTRVASTGLRFCGMAEDAPRPAAVGSATSPSSVLDMVCTSSANLPSAPVTRVSTEPSSATGVRRVCQGSTGSARPSASANGAISSTPCSGSSPSPGPRSMAAYSA